MLGSRHCYKCYNFCYNYYNCYKRVQCKLLQVPPSYCWLLPALLSVDNIGQMDVQPTHTFKNCPSVGISPRLFPLYPCYTFSLILISHLISLSQDGIIAFLLWGSAEQLPFTTSPEFKTFWDDIGGQLRSI